MWNMAREVWPEAKEAGSLLCRVGLDFVEYGMKDIQGKKEVLGKLCAFCFFFVSKCVLFCFRFSFSLMMDVPAACIGLLFMKHPAYEALSTRATQRPGYKHNDTRAPNPMSRRLR